MKRSKMHCRTNQFFTSLILCSKIAPMKIPVLSLFVLAVTGWVFPIAAASQDTAVTVYGVPVVKLARPRSADQSTPQFVEATVLPGAGMNLLQLKAYLPGSGEVSAIGTGTLADAKHLLEEDNDAFRNKSF